MKVFAKKSLALAVLTAVLLSAAFITTAWADEADDLVIDLNMELSSFQEELAESTIDLSFYRIADIQTAEDDETLIARSPVKEFAELGIEGLRYNETDEEMLALALEIAEELTPDATGKVENNKTTVLLQPGVYLLKGGSCESENREYLYTIEDAIVYVPALYDTKAELKVEKTQQFGDVVIEKELLSYNKTLGGAFFVFEIKAVKDKVTVYDDVQALSFTEPGIKQLRVCGIPVGSTVTVTEIYSGACYELQGTAATQSVTVEGPEVTEGIRFVNTYDDGFRSGTGIVNNYSYQGTDDSGSSNYIPQQLVDNEFEEN